MVNQYGTYVQGNLFRGSYKPYQGIMHTPRTGYSKANNIGYDVGYYGMLGYGLYQERAALGAAGRAVRQGIMSAGRAILGGAEAMGPELAEGAMIAGIPLGI